MLTRRDVFCQLCVAAEEMWHEHGYEHHRWQQEMQRGLQENLCAQHLHAALLGARETHCQSGTEMRHVSEEHAQLHQQSFRFTRPGKKHRRCESWENTDDAYIHRVIRPTSDEPLKYEL
jgi:hypothetical protein